MCGIAGIVGKFEPNWSMSRVEAMISTLVHRGPDAQGIQSWDHAILGHRRLAIIDLSDAGAQPMFSEGREVGVVFNGAIYNFLELRADLETLGYRFRGNSDTEVLLQGYRAWGIDTLVAKLHGMFAFAVWDAIEQRLFLVRDRLGVKPLLYSVHGALIAFASTPRALHRGGFVEQINDQAVAEFLDFGFVTDERCIYKDAFKVPAAHIVEWNNGHLSLRKYWAPLNGSELSLVAFDEAVAETERLFLRAVEMRLFADVPVGALLSGGIDSSLVCWAVKQLGRDITAFTVSTPDDPWDEAADASATAMELGIRHRVLQATAANSPDVHDLVSAFGEPFACASALGMLQVSNAVKREATVLLTGDGGDDLFLGYPAHLHFLYAQRLARILPKPAAAAWLRIRKLVPQRSAMRRASHFLDFATGGLGAVVSLQDGLPWYRAQGILGERFEAAPSSRHQIGRSIVSARNLLEEFLEFDRQTVFVGEYMTKVDGSTMFYGLEARSPFLDQELWGYASSLAFDVRMHNAQPKAILREMARRRIGGRVASGKKRGFGIPAQRWITGRWRQAVLDSMKDSVLERHGWIHSEPVVKHLQGLEDGTLAPKQLWYLYVLESWMRSEQAEVDGKSEPLAAVC